MDKVGWLRCLAILGLAGSTFLIGSVASADLVTQGQGRSQKLVRRQFSSEQQLRYDVFAKRCTKCHAMARPISALRTGITPVTGGVFDEESIRRYVVRMMRKPNSGIDRDDAREILLFLLYARNLAQQGGPDTATGTPRANAKSR